MQEQQDLNITVNGEPLSVKSGTTISDLLVQLKLNRRGIAVEINHEIEPGENHDQRQVNDGDWLEIVTLVGGG